jgi:anti-anti-sigma regulatory factor
LASIVTIGFEGGLDVSRHAEIAKRFAECPTGGETVIIQLSRATWVDSTAITELLLFYRKNHKLGRSVVIVAQGNVARMLLLAGITKRIPVFPDLDSAMKKLRGRPRQAGTNSPAPTTIRENIEKPRN